MASKEIKQLSRNSSNLSLNPNSVDFDLLAMTKDLSDATRSRKNSCSINDWEKDEIDALGLISTSPRQDFQDFVKELEKKLMLSLPKDSIESLSQALKKFMNNHIECTLIQIKQVIDDCYKLIQNYENFSAKEGHVSIGSFRVCIKISDDFHVQNKEKIAKNWVCEEINSGLIEFPDSILNICKNLESEMENAYKSEYSYTTNKMNSVHTQYKSDQIAELQYKTYKQNQFSQGLLKKELEWQRQELKVIKAQYKSKIHDLLQKDVLIKKELERIKKESIRLEKESLRIEKSWEKYTEEKKNLMNKIQKIESDSPNKTHSKLNSFASNHSGLSVSESSVVEEDELKELNQELKELEETYKNSSPGTGGAILVKINRLQTRISSIRSEKMISKSTNKSATVKNVLSVMQKVMSTKPPTFSVNKARTFRASGHYNNLNSSLSLALSPTHIRSTTFTPINFLNSDTPKSNIEASKTEKFNIFAQ